MSQYYYSEPISQLPPAPNGVNASNVYPATDPLDLTESPSGTTYKYSILQLQKFLTGSIVGSNVQSAIVATIGANLFSVYNNGLAGVGATLTNAGADVPFSLDGVPGYIGMVVLVKDQAQQLQNGVYTVTTLGDGATPWVLTRTPFYDGSTRTPMLGDFFGVVQGTENQLTFWFQTAPNPIVIGVSAIIFEESIGEGITIPLPVNEGGTGLMTFSPFEVLLGGISGTAPLQQVSGLGTAGYVLTSTGAASAPTWQVGGGGSGGLSWTSTAATTVSGLVENGYILTASSTQTLDLPGTFAIGQIVALEGEGSGGWIAQASTGSNIIMGTTVGGATGSVASTNRYNNVYLVGLVANTTWKVQTTNGTLTLT